MAKQATQVSPAPSGSEAKSTDLDLLLDLAEVFRNLGRLRADSVVADTELRKNRARVVQLEALLHSTSIALATLRSSDGADRVAVEILDTAVAGGRKAVASASDSAARASDALGPLMERLASTIADLEDRAARLQAQLSPATARLLATLARKSISPPIATISGWACGECHLRLPTALANSIIRDRTPQRCPYCKRILVPAVPGELASAS